MKFIRFLLAIFGLILVAFLIIGLLLPKDYSYESSRVIEAPPVVVFGLVNDVRKWEAWSPWADRDPSMVVTYGQRTIGAGGSYSWTSDAMGNGSLSITKSEPVSRIETALRFDTAEADGWWVFEPEGNGTKVTWGMEGEQEGIAGGYLAKLMPFFLANDFRTGLERLDVAAVAEAKEKGVMGSALEQVMQKAGQEIGAGIQEVLGGGSQ